MDEAKTSNGSHDWACDAAGRLVAGHVVDEGVCLLLGAADTGKTSLVLALANALSAEKPVGIVDADIGQSHIGPPTTVGCAIASAPVDDLSGLSPLAIAFAGDVTPVGHLLQFTAALQQCLVCLEPTVDTILIDTPGLVSGGAASALWWTVHRMVRPDVILAVQRENELDCILTGLCTFDTRIERIQTPPDIPVKSPERRRKYRTDLFRKYFQNATRHTIDLSEVALQTGRSIYHRACANCLVALKDRKGCDIALGLIEKEPEGEKVVIKTPLPDLKNVCGLAIGDVTLDLSV